MSYLVFFAFIFIFAIAFRQWAKFKAFRAEVVIECLRLWRENITDYYKRNPELKPISSIPEEAMYSALHSEHKQVMYAKAWANVKARKKSQ